MPMLGPQRGPPLAHPQTRAMVMAREAYSARYFALLYSPALQHVVLEALFGIEHEISESLRHGLDHQVAHSRLQWWREECERTADGRAVHPLTRSLVDALGPVRTPLAGLSGFVDVVTWDLASATFETRRELTAYCERWAAAMIEPLVAPAASPVGPPNWRAIGAAIREIELLSDLAREAHHGRLRLPLDELDRINADVKVLSKPPWPDTVSQLIRGRHQLLRDEIVRALADVDSKEQARGLLVWAALALRSSQRAERALPDRLRPGKFDAMSDAWFAWRIARKAMTGQLKLR
jgi:phytoene synthase